MNNYFSKDVKNLYSSILYLIFTILKQKWLTLLLIVLFCLLIWTPFSLWFTEQGSESVGYYVMSLFVILPITLIAFILIPIVHQQIFGSSIKLRMEAAGLSFKAYSFSLILIFTIFLTLLFYALCCIFAITFNVIYDFNTYQSSDIPLYHTSFGILEMIFLPVICITGLTSIGVLIGFIQMNEILKGLMIFVLLVFTFFFSAGSTWTLIFNSSNVTSNIQTFRMFLLNPFSTITYAFQTTINSDYSVVLNEYYDSGNAILNELMNTSYEKLFLSVQLSGCAYSFGFLGLAIWLS